MASRAQAATKRWRPSWPGWVAWLLVVVLGAVGTAYASGPLARSQGWLIDGGSPTVDAAVIEQLHPEPERLGAGVIEPAREYEGAQVSGERVQQAMAGVPPEVPGRFGGAVANLDGGELLYDLDANAALIPASTMKVITAVAVLDALGPDHRFTTQVVSTAPGQLVLVGGGDPLLMSDQTSYAHAATVTLPTLTELATQTATALQAQGVAEVSLGFDDSMFTGPNWHPDWDPADRQFAAPVSALVVDEASGQPGIESPSPAAAQAFAAALQAAGIAVTGAPAPASGADGTLLAKIDSAPVSLLVQEMLVYSNNFVAEMLAHQVALVNGQPGSFEGGAAAATSILQELGVWREGQQIADGSGLSTNNRLTPAGLVAALQLAAERPELAATLAGMPVGCATGTLTNRFTDERSVAARGQVRAKTGTLNKVSGLAGYTRTADGAVLAFAFIGNDLPTDRDVRAWFDHVGAALAGCDCVG